MRPVLFVSILLLGAALAFAQQGNAPPPSDYGIGNATMSPNSDVSNNPSFSPDQNQAITNDRGSSTGDKYRNPAFAGSTGQQTSGAANAQGAVGATGSTSATAGRRSPHARKKARRNTRRKRNQTAGGAKTQNSQSTAAKRAQQNSTVVRTPLYPSSGPSTTEAPGPATDFKGNKKVPQGGEGQYSGTSAATQAGPTSRD